MKIALRADSSLIIGTGHMRRCLSLIDAIKRLVPNVELTVFSNQQLPLFRSELKAYHAEQCSAFDFLEELAVRGEFDFCIFDSYDTDYKEEAAAKEFCKCIVVIDDYFKNKHCSDIYVNQNITEIPKWVLQRQLIATERTFVGPKYALLRDEFAECAKQVAVRSGSIKNILIMMGGVDYENVTGYTLRNLPYDILTKRHININVVIGHDNPHREDLELLCLKIPAKIYIQPRDLTEIMKDTDLAIAAAGSNTWERCCLGIPSIIVVVAENQQLIAQTIEMENCGMKVDFQKHDSKSVLRAAIENLIKNPALVKSFSRNSLALTSGDGATLVAKGMLECLKLRS